MTKLFISTDYNIIDSRLGKLLDLEFSLNYVEEVITTNSAHDSFIIDYCVAKGVEFKIFDLSYRYEPKALELVCQDIDKIVLLSSMNNSFYLSLFKEAEKWVIFEDNFRAPLSEVKSILKANYKEKVQIGSVNNFQAYQEEYLNPLSQLNKISIVILDKRRS